MHQDQMEFMQEKEDVNQHINKQRGKYIINAIDTEK